MLGWDCVTFDGALNLAWLVLGAIAFAMLLPSRFGRRKFVSESWLRLAAVMAIACTLFPYVSATDDLVWFETSSTLSEHQSDRQTDSSNSNSGLLGLYHASQSSVRSGTISVFCILIFLALIVLPALRRYSSVEICTAGRSPPALKTV